MLIQLPDDVILVGCHMSGFQAEQIFTSEKHGFTGSEMEFLLAGLAYKYVQLDKFTRRTLALG